MPVEAVSLLVFDNVHAALLTGINDVLAQFKEVSRHSLALCLQIFIDTLFIKISKII
jgi:hypothetical protein